MKKRDLYCMVFDKFCIDIYEYEGDSCDIYVTFGCSVCPYAKMKEVSEEREHDYFMG